MNNNNTIQHTLKITGVICKFAIINEPTATTYLDNSDKFHIKKKTDILHNAISEKAFQLNNSQ